MELFFFSFLEIKFGGFVKQEIKLVLPYKLIESEQFKWTSQREEETRSFRRVTIRCRSA